MKAPVLLASGAVAGVAGGLLVDRYYPVTHHSCSGATPQVSNIHAVAHCLGPGALAIAGVVLGVGGTVLFLYAASLLARSAGQRQRPPARRGYKSPPATELASPHEGATGWPGATPTSQRAGPGGGGAAPDGRPGPRSVARAAASPADPTWRTPPAGWYHVPPTLGARWWDGAAWGSPPALPPPGWYAVSADEPPWWWDGSGWSPPAGALPTPRG